MFDLMKPIAPLCKSPIQGWQIVLQIWKIKSKKVSRQLLICKIIFDILISIYSELARRKKVSLKQNIFYYV